MKFNQKFAEKLVNTSLTAAQTAQQLNFSDPNEGAQYLFAILAVAGGLLPFGASISSFATLVGQVLFPAQHVDLWKALRERIEALINAKISEYHVKILSGRVDGLVSNMDALTGHWRAYEKAKTPEEKERARNTLKTHHIAFLAVVRTHMPDFQSETYAVAALPLFAMAANIHVMLLVDGIKHGKDWGYSTENIFDMQKEFDKITMPKLAGVATGESTSQLDSLKEAIEEGEKLGWSSSLLETWREAYSDLQHPDNGNKGSYLDYPAHARKFYEEGRKKVQGYKGELPEYENWGMRKAAELRAYTDYDTSMVMCVLNYAEMWPYMAGKDVPETTLQLLDREIFFGPYGRGIEATSWTTTKPPPVVPRSPAITTLWVRAWDDIDALWIKYGTSWGKLYGNDQGGKLKTFDISGDQSIDWVWVQYGHKLGSLKFWIGNKECMKQGNGKHGSNVSVDIHPPGYGLTSACITQYGHKAPRGCEGIVLGFRPLLIENKAAESPNDTITQQPSTEAGHHIGDDETSEVTDPQRGKTNSTV